MYALELKILLWAAAALAWLLAILSILYYLVADSGWPTRKKKIVESLSVTALEKYYGLYFPVRKIEGDYTKEFQKDYSKKYGRRNFIVPVMLFALMVAVGLWMAVQSIAKWLGVAPAGTFALRVR